MVAVLLDVIISSIINISYPVDQRWGALRVRQYKFYI